MATIKYSQRFNKDFFEQAAWQDGKVICGIDEVGRGCLAGPVVTAAAILHPHKTSRLIKDSKLLTQDELLKAYKWLMKHCWYSVAVVNHRNIDIHNIYHATLIAMKRAIMQLMIQCPQQPSTILIDAMPVKLDKTPYGMIDVLHFPFGEKKSSSIAAASIIAKVKRDQIMRNLDPVFPGYRFALHKGYSTKIHQEAVKNHGRSIIHRLSFLKEKSWLLTVLMTKLFQ